MSYMSQNFRLFLVSNLSVLNFRIFLLMYPGYCAGAVNHDPLQIYSDFMRVRVGNGCRNLLQRGVTIAELTTRSADGMSCQSEMVMLHHRTPWTTDQCDHELRKPFKVEQSLGYQIDGMIKKRGQITKQLFNLILIKSFHDPSI